MLFIGNIIQKLDWNYYQQKPEFIPETWYVNEIFSIMMTRNVSLKRSCKVLFNGNVFVNDDWNYYHQIPETNRETLCINEKVLVVLECYTSLEKDLKRGIQW